MTVQPDYKTLYENLVLELETMHEVLKVKDDTIGLLQKSQDGLARSLMELELKFEALQDGLRQMARLGIK